MGYSVGGGTGGGCYTGGYGYSNFSFILFLILILLFFGNGFFGGHGGCSK